MASRPATTDSSNSIRVAILSDTHGYVCPNVLEVVASCDVAVHAGDISSAGVLQQLREVTGEVHAVRGNNDVPGLWAVDELDILNDLPEVAELQLPGGMLVVEHGHSQGWAEPDIEGLRCAHPRARSIAYGHTHRLLIDQSKAPWIINPGAAGRIRNRGGPSCVVLAANRDTWALEPFKFSE